MSGVPADLTHSREADLLDRAWDELVRGGVRTAADTARWATVLGLHDVAGEPVPAAARDRVWGTLVFQTESGSPRAFGGATGAPAPLPSIKWSQVRPRDNERPGRLVWRIAEVVAACLVLVALVGAGLALAPPTRNLLLGNDPPAPIPVGAAATADEPFATHVEPNPTSVAAGAGTPAPSPFSGATGSSGTVRGGFVIGGENVSGRQTPEPAPLDLDVMIVPDPVECRVSRRSVEEIRALVAEPRATGTPDAGWRDQAAAGVPADELTIREVIRTIREFAACLAAGDDLRAYALASDNMIRLAAARGALSDALLDEEAAGGGNVGGTRTVIITAVRLFADGRAGAVVFLDGKLAYLTFVHQGDRWLIDAWDEGDAVATPAAH